MRSVLLGAVTSTPVAASIVVWALPESQLDMTAGWEFSTFPRIPLKLGAAADLVEVTSLVPGPFVQKGQMRQKGGCFISRQKGGGAFLHQPFQVPPVWLILDTRARLRKRRGAKIDSLFPTHTVDAKMGPLPSLLCGRNGHKKLQCRLGWTPAS